MENASIKELTTNRLKLDPLTIDDHQFILLLVNTPGWIKFIGDRNINDIEAAKAYIDKILANPAIFYQVVKLNKEPIGIITFLKRDYLEHYDLGFAFLPGYTKNGYALEAATAALNDFSRRHGLNQFQGITIADNISSINLLQKLGFIFNGEMQTDHNIVQVYSLKL